MKWMIPKGVMRQAMLLAAAVVPTVVVTSLAGDNNFDPWQIYDKLDLDIYRRRGIDLPRINYTETIIITTNISPIALSFWLDTNECSFSAFWTTHTILLSSTTGWGTNFGGRSTANWNPQTNAAAKVQSK